MLWYVIRFLFSSKWLKIRAEGNDGQNGYFLRERFLVDKNEKDIMTNTTCFWEIKSNQYLQ